MAITNPNPIALATADKLWASRIVITPASVMAQLFPYDGAHIVGGAAEIRIVTPRGQGDVIATLAATIQAIGNLPTQPQRIDIIGPDPSLPVRIYADGVTIIDDLFAVLSQQAGGPSLADAVYAWLSQQVTAQREAKAQRAAAAQRAKLFRDYAEAMRSGDTVTANTLAQQLKGAANV